MPPYVTQTVNLYPAWAMFGIGLYCIAAAIGELRQPGLWASMVVNISEQPALRFLTGIVCLAIGTALYLAGHWSTADMIALIVKILGAWIVIEGVLFLAIGDIFLKLSHELLGQNTRGWAIFALIIGIAALLAAASRLHGLA